MSVFFSKVRVAWKSAFSTRAFRLPFIYGMVFIGVMISMLPDFYAYIEKREGMVLNDWLLEYLPPTNVSVPVFILIWAGAILVLYRAFTAPRIFLDYLLTSIVFIFIRSICLLLVALDPPRGIIELIDPLSNLFYGGSFITKDLFFSGHTATLVIMSLCVTRKKDKYYFWAAAFLVAILLLVQHVHYTIDVVAAPFFAVFSFWVGQQFLEKMQVPAVYPVK